jgi:hypothetical protein
MKRYEAHTIAISLLASKKIWDDVPKERIVLSYGGQHLKPIGLEAHGSSLCGS